MNGFGVQVIEDALHHATVKKEAFDFVALPGPGGVSRLAVDVARLEELGLVERMEDETISVPFESIEILLPLAQVA